MATKRRAPKKPDQALLDLAIVIGRAERLTWEELALEHKITVKQCQEIFDRATSGYLAADVDAAITAEVLHLDQVSRQLMERLASPDVMAEEAVSVATKLAELTNQRLELQGARFAVGAAVGIGPVGGHHTGGRHSGAQMLGATAELTAGGDKTDYVAAMAAAAAAAASTGGAPLNGHN